MAWKPCSFCRGIGIHFAVEFVFSLPWNPCSLWRGIFSDQVCARRRLPVIYRGLAMEMVRHGYIGPDIVGADSAARRDAGDNDRSKEVFG
jgi:hypothetical protein